MIERAQRPPEPPAVVTLAPKNDGVTLFLNVLSMVVGLLLIGSVVGVVLSSRAGWLMALLGILNVILAMDYVWKSFQITYAPDAITWSNCFGGTSVDVADVVRCTIKTTTSRRSIFGRLTFYLRDGSRKRTPGIWLASYPGLLSELKKRYTFPVGH